jgi:hypothetical protein
VSETDQSAEQIDETHETATSTRTRRVEVMLWERTDLIEDSSLYTSLTRR